MSGVRSQRNLSSMTRVGEGDGDSQKDVDAAVKKLARRDTQSMADNEPDA
jgi:hypothetical protein